MRSVSALLVSRIVSASSGLPVALRCRPGEMQIDRRLLQIAMPEQHLNGAQVGTGFQQMRSEAVAPMSLGT